MAGSIKGITIEFDGDTTKLTAALNKVKAESKGIDSALKEVNRQLKFNPRDTDMLSQKQTLLKQRIEQSKNAIAEMKDLQQQMIDQKVDKKSAQYMKLQREITAAQGKLRAFNAQLAKANWARVKYLGKDITAVGQKLTRATRYARLFAGALAGIALYKGFERLKALDEVSKQMEVLGYRGKKLEGIMNDVSQSVNGTRFMLQDMGKVATGALGAGVTEKYKLVDYLTRTADLAQLAGVSVEEMGGMMNKAYSKGKVQAQLMNQFNQRGIPIYKLLQKELGVTADELQDMSKKGLITFDDLYRATAKYEGLAEKMGTETLPGALTVLSQQFGLIGADFLSGVYEPLKDGVRGIVAAIKELRQSGTFKEWGKDLGDTVKYFVQYFKEGEASMLGLSDRAQNLVTVLSPLITTIGKLVQALAALPPELQGIIVFMTLFGGPLLTVLGSGITMFANLATAVQTFGLNVAAGVGPVGQMTAGVGGLSGVMSALISPLGLATLGLAAWALGMKKAYDEEHQWTQGFEEWKTAADENIATVKAEAGQVDIYKKKLDELIGKENKSAGEKALIKEYVNQLNGAIDGLNLKYDEEKDKLNQTTSAIQKKIDKYKELALVKAYEDQITEAAKKQAQAQIELSDLYEKREAEIKKYNKSTEHSALLETQHKQTLAELNNKIRDCKNSISQYGAQMGKAEKQIKALTGTTEKEFSNSVKKAEKAGREVPQKYSSGISSGKGAAGSAAKSVAESAKSNLSVNTSGMGRDFGNGFKNGILSVASSVATAASNLVKRAIAAAKAAQNSGSPSKVMRSVGRDYGAGYALGIGDEAVPVITASRHLISSAIGAATVPATAGASLQMAGGTSSGGSTSNVYNNTFNINSMEDGELIANAICRKLETESRSR